MGTLVLRSRNVGMLTMKYRATIIHVHSLIFVVHDKTHYERIIYFPLKAVAMCCVKTEHLEIIESTERIGTSTL